MVQEIIMVLKSKRLLKRGCLDSLYKMGVKHSASDPSLCVR